MALTRVSAQTPVPMCCRWEPSPLGPVVGGPTIVVDVNPTGFNLPPEMILAYVQRGLDAWNVSGTSFQYVLGTVLTGPPQNVVPHGRVTVIGWPTPTGSGADTRRLFNVFWYDLDPFVSYFTDGTLYGALVRMKSTNIWGPLPDGRPGALSFVAVLVHELGHALGMDHAVRPGSVMGVVGETIRVDDVATMKEVYGKARAPYRVRLH